MTGQTADEAGIEAGERLPHTAASLTLLQITSRDLMLPQSKALPRTRGLRAGIREGLNPAHAERL